jgi:LPS-assembly lipoprotein
MSSSDRRTALALLAALPLAACGFAPVHGPGGAGDALRGRILADAPNTRLAYAFVARFEDRLGRAEAPAWALGYTIATREIAVGVSADNVTTRYNLTGRLTWSIRPMGGDEPVLSGAEESFTAFSATGSAVSTLTARRDAEDRLMAIIADHLVTRLYAEVAALAP